MAILTTENCTVTRDGDRLRLQIAGKTHFAEARTASRLAIILGNAAVDLLDRRDVDTLPAAQDIRMSPPDEHGRVSLLIATTAGLLQLAIGPGLLEALAKASEAALEHGAPRGTA